MSDIIDQAQDLTEVFTREALYKHSLKMQQAATEPCMCAHCEENEVKVLATGLRMAYCQRCIDELALTNL